MPCGAPRFVSILAVDCGRGCNALTPAASEQGHRLNFAASRLRRNVRKSVVGPSHRTTKEIGPNRKGGANMSETEPQVRCSRLKSTSGH
jgi:hypothetical protein